MLGFESGNPVAAYQAAVALAASHREVFAEAAQLRFQANFGTSVCDSCDGLKAGPGVIATCHQVRRCLYDNFKEGVVDPRQARILRMLGKE